MQRSNITLWIFLAIPLLVVVAAILTALFRGPSSQVADATVRVEFEDKSVLVKATIETLAVNEDDNAGAEFGLNTTHHFPEVPELSLPDFDHPSWELPRPEFGTISFDLWWILDELLYSASLLKAELAGLFEAVRLQICSFLFSFELLTMELRQWLQCNMAKEPPSHMCKTNHLLSLVHFLARMDRYADKLDGPSDSSEVTNTTTVTH